MNTLFLIKNFFIYSRLFGINYIECNRQFINLLTNLEVLKKLFQEKIFLLELFKLFCVSVEL